MASIADIARAAGVSASTVSKALNGYSDIGESTRKRILDIAKELNYTPNMLARSLALQKPTTLALIFSDIKDTDNNGNIIFRLFISSVKYCSQHGYELLVIHTSTELQKKKPLKTLLDERRIGGAIFYGFKMADSYIQQIPQVSAPIALIDTFLNYSNTFTVTIDSQQAIFDMLKQVVEKQRHQKIVLMSGTEAAYISKVRYNAFTSACELLHIDIGAVKICTADFLEATAYRVATEMIQSHPDVTCFFCMSDIMAIGVIRALRDLGKSVPTDVAVTGFDGIQISEYITPSLTTIKQDFKAMGHLASKALIDAFNEEPTQRIIYAPYSLRLGDSL